MRKPDQASRPRVLVALDGSPAAALALPLARIVATQLSAALEILHVASNQGPDRELWRQLHRDLEEGEAVQVRSHVGEPASAILRAAADPGVLLVVLTTHGRIVEPSRHLGHVAETIAAQSQRPVLLVRPEAAVHLGARPPPLRRLLLPVDGTPTTAAALRPATELAARLGASLDLLYVAGPDQLPPGEPGSMGAPWYVDQPQHEWPHWASEVLDRLCACLADCPAGVPVQVSFAYGEIDAEIVRFAMEHHADTIVLVRRSRLEPGRAPVLRAVLDRTPCAVLLLGGPASG